MRFVKSAFTLPGFGIREGDKGLFDPPQIERGIMSCHRLFEALHIAINVLVEQRQEEAEVFRVALVRRRRHQEIVIGHCGKRLAQLVGQRLLVGAVGRHLVGFIDDDQVPMAA